MYLFYTERYGQPTIHSHYLKRYFNSLSNVNHQRRHCYIPQCALQRPMAGAFVCVMRSEHDGALIQATGVDFQFFGVLLKKISPMFHHVTLYSEDGNLRKKKIKDCPRTFHPATALGLVLMWTRSCGSNRIFSMILGATLSPLNLWLRFTIRCLLKVLRKEAYPYATPPSSVQL